MKIIRSFCATALALIAVAGMDESSATAFQADLVDNLAAGDEVQGLGLIEWDAGTLTMTRFEWDFLEGAQPGGKGNVIRPATLTGALGSGTFGAALWEVITGEDVFPGTPSSVDALSLIGDINSNDISSNGFPNLRASFLPVGLFSFFSLDISGQEVLVGEGTIRIRAVPEPASLALLGIGLAGLGFTRKKRVH